jgi:hypothetical protein
MSNEFAARLFFFGIPMTVNVTLLAAQVDQLAGSRVLNRVVLERQERRARRLSEPVPEHTPQ